MDPRLECETSADQTSGLVSVKCTPNDEPDEVVCNIDGNPLTPCE